MLLVIYNGHLSNRVGMSNSAFTRAGSVTESERPIHSFGGEMLSANRMPARKQVVTPEMSMTGDPSGTHMMSMDQPIQIRRLDRTMS
jgi:hypothetical protein